MLDTTLFNVQLSIPQTRVNKSLILTGCIANLLPEKDVYSEFDHLNFYPLNCNDYDFGRVDIEFCFENSFDNPYFEFYVKCFAIRTDTGVLRKIDINSTPKKFMTPNFSKVNMDNKLVMGISYYFESEKERIKVEKCKQFCIEGFIALKKKTNVYGVMCKIENLDNVWHMVSGNTYRIYKRTNIDDLWH